MTLFVSVAVNVPQVSGSSTTICPQSWMPSTPGQCAWPSVLVPFGARPSKGGGRFPCSAGVPEPGRWLEVVDPGLPTSQQITLARRCPMIAWHVGLCIGLMFSGSNRQTCVHLKGIHAGSLTKPEAPGQPAYPARPLRGSKSIAPARLDWRSAARTLVEGD